MKRNHQTALTLALGSALAATLASAPVSAADNPFASQSMAKGYMVAERGGMEGKCGEGKCGGTMKGDARKAAQGKTTAEKAKEGKCGNAKEMEGKCGSSKAVEGKCGGAKSMDGKCGGARK